MSLLVDLLARKDLDVEAPFDIEIDGEVERFQCLIRGYGAPLGMIVDRDGKRLVRVCQFLQNLGYGYSCLDIEQDNSPAQDFIDDVLVGDWGVTT